MAADRLWKFLVSSFTAMLNSLKTSFKWPVAAPKIKAAPVPPTPPRDRDLTDMEILDVLQAVHDLRNQLMVMRLATNDLLEDSPNRAERLDQLQRSVERAAVLINALLLDEQTLMPRRAHVDANEVVRRTATTLSLSPSEAIRLQLVLWPAPLAVVAEAGDLDRILLNLVFNAFDAMPNGGVLTIETAISDVRGWANASPPDQYARLTIRDTGCGMTPEVKDRIFDPFFTTKQGGTGLGLRSVAFTVEQLHGRISVDSEPGRGTSVTVLLPLASETPILNFPDRMSDSRRLIDAHFFFFTGKRFTRPVDASRRRASRFSGESSSPTVLCATPRHTTRRSPALPGSSASRTSDPLVTTLSEVVAGGNGGSPRYGTAWRNCPISWPVTPTATST